jgi:hypothetical protein
VYHHSKGPSELKWQNGAHEICEELGKVERPGISLYASDIVVNRELPVPVAIDAGVALPGTGRFSRRNCRLGKLVVGLLWVISFCLSAALSGCGFFPPNGADAGTLVALPSTVTFGAAQVGQTAKATVSLVNRGSSPIEISHLSVNGQFFSVGEGISLPVTIAPGGTYGFNVQFSPSSPGTVIGQLTLTSNDTAAGTSTISLSGTATAGAQPASAAIPASFFGLTVLNFDKLTPLVSFGTTRSWDAYPDFDWADINPSPGVFDFTFLDQFIAINRARGAEIIYTLNRTPHWASSQPNARSGYSPGECAPPADMTSYDEYLTAIATHVAGQIKYWELWNEPQDPTSYCGKISTMVTMAQHASRIIKGIDPNALILSPAPTGGQGPAWMGSFLAAGGSEYVDVIAFHGYWSAQAEDVVGVISNYKAVMTENGVADKPMWDTESSWAAFGTLPTPSISRQVGFIAKDYLLHWSQGVTRFVWYAYDGGPIWGGLWSSPRGDSAAAISYGQTYKWLVGATLTAPCSENAAGIWACTLSRPSGYTAEVLWISNGTSSIPVPAEYTVYQDLSGAVHPVVNQTITLDDQPILLETTDLSS